VRKTKTAIDRGIELRVVRQTALNAGAKRGSVIDFPMHFMCTNLSCSACGVDRYVNTELTSAPPCGTRKGNKTLPGGRCTKRMSVSNSTGKKVDAARKKKKDNAKRPQAQAESSKHRGVSWQKSRKKWAARITNGGKRRHLGLFEDEEAAARAYDEAAMAQQGEKKV
jgi:hypothetical protein